MIKSNDPNFQWKQKGQYEGDRHLNIEGYRGFTALHLIKKTEKKYAFIASYDTTSRKSMRKEEDKRLVNSSSRIHLFLTPKYENTVGNKKASMNYI